MTDTPPVVYYDLGPALDAMGVTHQDVAEQVTRHAQDEHKRRKEQEQALLARRKLEQQQEASRG